MTLPREAIDSAASALPRPNVAATRRLAERIVGALHRDGWLRPSTLQHPAFDGDGGQPDVIATLRSALRQAIGIDRRRLVGDDPTIEWAPELERSLWEEGLLLLPVPKAVQAVLPQDVRLLRPAEGCVLVLTIDRDTYPNESEEQLVDDLRAFAAAWGARGSVVLPADATLASLDKEGIEQLGLSHSPSIGQDPAVATEG